MFNFNLNAILAPEGVSAVHVETQSALVEVMPPEIKTGIDHFVVAVQGSDPIVKCTVEANADPLECELTELTPASEQIIQAYSCLAGSLGCSSPVEGIFLDLSFA